MRHEAAGFTVVLHHQPLVDEGGGGRVHGTVAIGHHRGAIEHQRVLATDHVEVGNRRPLSRVRAASTASRWACLPRSYGDAFGTTTSCAPARTVSANGSANHRSSQISRPTGTPLTSNTQLPPSGSTSK